MKISPVQGTPTIANPSQAGLSPEKLLRIKAIANNQTPADVTEEKTEKDSIQLGEIPTSATQRIRMNTNQTVHRNGDLPLAEAEAPVVEATPQQETKSDTAVGISDTTEQAKPVLGATKPISPELAELAIQRRALQVKERELLEKEKALQSQVPEGYFKIQDLKSNALSTLQKHGISYQQLTDEILGQKTQPDFNQFKEEILKSIDEKLAGKDTAQEEAVYSYMKQNVDKMSFSSDKYKLIRETKSQPKVMDLVKRMWTEKGEILDEQEAMDLIEAELKEEAKLYARTLGYAEPAQTAPEVPATQVPRGIVKTLTNKDSARPLMTPKQRAIAAFLGQK